MAGWHRMLAQARADSLWLTYSVPKGIPKLLAQLNPSFI